MSKLLFVGAGAVGSYIGAFLSRAGHDLTFVDPWAEQIEAPRERGAQRLMPLGEIALAPAQQRQRLVETRQHRLRRQHAHPGGGELDRQRQAVETAAQFGHCSVVVLIDAEVGAHLARPLLDDVAHRREPEPLDGADSLEVILADPAAPDECDAHRRLAHRSPSGWRPASSRR